MRNNNSHWIQKLYLFIFLFFVVQIHAVAMNTQETPVVKMPSPLADGRIPTLNNMGWVLQNFDPYTLAFIKYASKVKEPVLEIGAAYGFAVIEALKNGAVVVANDMDVRHLQILRFNAPKAYLSNLSLKPGKYPTELHFASNTFAAILAARVLVFFNGAELEAAIQDMYRILQLNGKLFIVADSPYLKNWQTFASVYEERKRKGDLFPGFVEAPALYNPKRALSLPKYIHFLDKEVLIRVLKKAGFKIETIEYMNRKDYPAEMQLDGRESVGVIAVKPAGSES